MFGGECNDVEKGEGAVAGQCRKGRRENKEESER